MKPLRITQLIAIPSTRFWLLFLGAELVSIHLTLVWRTNITNLLVISFVFWLTVLQLIWSRNQQLKLETGLFASMLGGILLSLLLFKSMTGQGQFLYVYPFIAGIGLSLLASGFRGLGEYRQELFLLFFLGVPQGILASLFDPSPLTARCAAALLWYLGHPVTLQGIVLFLPGGSIEVYSACSGLELMTNQLSISVLSLALLPLPWSWGQKLLLCCAAVIIGFVVNASRVVLMAILVAQGQAAAFEFWHTGKGSLIFSGIAALLLVLLIAMLVKLSINFSTSDESLNR